MPDNRFYLDQIVSMEFKGVEWTREKILEVAGLALTVEPQYCLAARRVHDGVR